MDSRNEGSERDKYYTMFSPESPEREKQYIANLEMSLADYTMQIIDKCVNGLESNRRPVNSPSTSPQKGQSVVTQNESPIEAREIQAGSYQPTTTEQISNLPNQEKSDPPVEKCESIWSLSPVKRQLFKQKNTSEVKTQYPINFPGLFVPHHLNTILEDYRGERNIIETVKRVAEKKSFNDIQTTYMEAVKKRSLEKLNLLPNCNRKHKTDATDYRDNKRNCTEHCLFHYDTKRKLEEDCQNTSLHKPFTDVSLLNNMKGSGPQSNTTKELQTLDEIHSNLNGYLKRRGEPCILNGIQKLDREQPAFTFQRDNISGQNFKYGNREVSSPLADLTNRKRPYCSVFDDNSTNGFTKSFRAASTDFPLEESKTQKLESEQPAFTFQRENRCGQNLKYGNQEVSFPLADLTNKKRPYCSVFDDNSANGFVESFRAALTVDFPHEESETQSESFQYSRVLPIVKKMKYDKTTAQPEPGFCETCQNMYVNILEHQELCTSETDESFGYFSQSDSSIEGFLENQVGNLQED